MSTDIDWSYCARVPAQMTLTGFFINSRWLSVAPTHLSAGDVIDANADGVRIVRDGICVAVLDYQETEHG